MSRHGWEKLLPSNILQRFAKNCT